jgi:hypothetical protein
MSDQQADGRCRGRNRSNAHVCTPLCLDRNWITGKSRARG